MKATETSVLDRMKQALSAASLDELAERLGEKRSTVGGWSARGSVPLDPIVRTAEITKRSLDWLVLGRPQPERSLREHGAPLRTGPHTQSQTLVAAETALPYPRPPPGIDKARLALALSTVNEALTGAGRVLGPDQHAELVLAAYDLLGDKGRARDQLVKLIWAAA